MILSRFTPVKLLLIVCKVFNCIKCKLEKFSKLGLPVQLYIKYTSSQIF